MALFIPSAGQCLSIAAPVAAVWGIVWFARNGDRVIERLFPSWRWERELGWLNIRAHRRADAIMRALRDLGHAFLLLALVGILVIAWFIGHPDTESAIGLLVLANQYVYLGLCLAPWIYYFRAILGPRLQAEFEEEELARYRAEHPDVEHEEAEARRGPLRVTTWDSVRPRRF